MHELDHKDKPKHVKFLSGFALVWFDLGFETVPHSVVQASQNTKKAGYVTQASLELMATLPCQLPMCWHYKCRANMPG